MSITPWLPQIVVSVLILLSGTAVGGLIFRSGTFRSTFELLQKEVNTYVSLKQMDDLRLTQMTADRDAAVAERDAERSRSSRLERLLSDCQIDKADLERENARLRSGPQP